MTMNNNNNKLRLYQQATKKKIVNILPKDNSIKHKILEKIGSNWLIENVYKKTKSDGLFLKINVAYLVHYYWTYFKSLLLQCFA